jgi:two-component system, chemotaxis family, protein-glutamate methylesterase/glutaminase
MGSPCTPQRLPPSEVSIQRGTQPYEALGVAYSAGGLSPCMEMLRALPRCFGLPIFVVQHVSSRFPSWLPEILTSSSGFRAKWAEAGEKPLASTIYVAPPDRHLVIAPDGVLALTLSALVNYSRPAADPLFESMARVFGSGAVSVVLSGLLRDGARGTAAVKQCGGLTMAQDKATSAYFDMPSAAIDLGKAELVLSPRRLALALSVIAAT